MGAWVSVYKYECFSLMFVRREDINPRYKSENNEVRRFSKKGTKTGNENENETQPQPDKKFTNIVLTLIAIARWVFLSVLASLTLSLSLSLSLSLCFPQITGGTFVANEADLGGFLFKEGDGKATCTGASILGHKGVDGGAIYAVDGADLYWECDLINNEALSGPAM